MRTLAGLQSLRLNHRVYAGWDFKSAPGSTRRVRLWSLTLAGMTDDFKVLLAGKPAEKMPLNQATIDDKSICRPGPIVLESVIFWRYTPLDVAGLAFFRSATSASIFCLIASAVKPI